MQTVRDIISCIEVLVPMKAKRHPSGKGGAACSPFTSSGLPILFQMNIGADSASNSPRCPRVNPHATSAEVD